MQWAAAKQALEAQLPLACIFSKVVASILGGGLVIERQIELALSEDRGRKTSVVLPTARMKGYALSTHKKSKRGSDLIG